MTASAPLRQGAIREFERSLPMSLLRAREAVMRQFRPILAEHGLTEQQWRVLRALMDSPTPLSVNQLSDRTFLLGPSLSRMLRTLERSELITRTQDPDDARSFFIALTRKSKRLVAKIGPLSEERYEWITAQLGADQLDRLYELLHLVSALDT